MQDAHKYARPCRDPVRDLALRPDIRYCGSMNRIRTVSWIASGISLSLLVSCASQAKEPRVETPLPENSIRFSDRVVFEIDPRIELLAGVQSQNSWTKGSRGPGAEPNAYFMELREFFSPHRKAAAVKASQGLLNTGFSYDAPCAFALSLGKTSSLAKPAEGWTPYLRGRAIFPRRLDSLARSLSILFDASGFSSFLDAHRDDYRRWLEGATTGIDPDRMVDWLEAFYAVPGAHTYHFVLAPAMFPSGGYGFSLTEGRDGTERLHVYQIVRAARNGKEPGFPSGNALLELGLHEFGHSFVNPVIGKAAAKDKRLSGLLRPVKRKMAAMAYPSVEAFMNELVIRAAVIVAMRDLGLREGMGIEAAIRGQEKQGFYPIREVIRLLDGYASDRGRYPDFASYAPRLLSGLSSQVPDLLRRAESSGYRGLDRESPVAGFHEDFEGEAGALGLPAGFDLDLGSSLSDAMARPSRVAVSRGEDGASLVLSADDATDHWFSLSRPLELRPGELRLGFRARAEGIHAAPGQFGGSYLGFILTGKDGKRSFKVQSLAGSFPWKDFEYRCLIDPASTAAVEFMIFLNESGTLMVDDIVVGYGGGQTP